MNLARRSIQQAADVHDSLCKLWGGETLLDPLSYSLLLA